MALSFAPHTAMLPSHPPPPRDGQCTASQRTCHGQAKTVEAMPKSFIATSDEFVSFTLKF
eukprot:351612-Chlamydomonas_euryale.AAC.25